MSQVLGLGLERRPFLTSKPRPKPLENGLVCSWYYNGVNWTGCSVSGDTLQYRLGEGVSHRHTGQVTQLFTYLLTQRRTAATPTSVCLLLRHDSARRPRWPSTIAENLGRYLSCTKCTSQGKDFELILTIKMKTRHPVGWPFGREFSAFVIIAELRRPEVASRGNFVSNFFRFVKTPLKLSLMRGSRPKSARASPHIWITLFQISSKAVHFRRSYYDYGGWTQVFGRTASERETSGLFEKRKFTHPTCIWRPVRDASIRISPKSLASKN